MTPLEFLHWAGAVCAGLIAISITFAMCDVLTGWIRYMFGADGGSE